MYIHYTYLPDADIKRSQFLLLNPFGMVGYVPIFKKPNFLVSRRNFFICFKYMKLKVIVKIHQMMTLKKKSTNLLDKGTIQN